MQTTFKLDQTDLDFHDPRFTTLLTSLPGHILNAHGRDTLEHLVEIATIKEVEYGQAMRDAIDVGLEHNGYADGISQPLFLKGDIADFKKNNPGPEIYDPTANLGLVLQKDPFGTNEE